MSKASDQFEILVSRIHELLEGDDATVKWNERIPDPDNPIQGRQIDILIKKDGLINFIECRLHKEKQDVKWIEELIGRRISLNANSIMAVSSSGFTSGAILKASRYGILLKDLTTLTDVEISSWSRSIDISIFYYRYKDFKLTFFFEMEDAGKIERDQVQSELQEYVGFNTLFKAQLELLDEEKLIVKGNRNKSIKFKVNFGIEDFQVCGCLVREIESSGVAYLEEVKLRIPEVLAYGNVGLNSKERNVYVQNYNLGETKVIHHDGHVSLTLDLSKIEIPPYWQFRFVDIGSKNENNMDLFEIVDPEKINMKIDKVDLSIVSVPV